MSAGFTIVNESSKSLARRGVYSFGAGSKVKNIQTPGFIMPTSRGVIAHMTPDHIENKTDLPGISLGSEDCKFDLAFAKIYYSDCNIGLEKLPDEPPLFKYPGPVRDLMSLPSDIPIFASIRRAAPAQLAKSNGDKYVSIMTSEGTRELSLPDYYRFISKVSPDAILAVADLPSFSLKSDHRPSSSPEDVSTGIIPKPGGNRTKKMIFRTERWMQNLLEYLAKHPLESKAEPAIFAPILPYVDLRSQESYIDYVQSLNDNGKISGLTLWSHFGNLSEREKDNTVANSPVTEEKQQSLWESVVSLLKERKLDQLIRYNNAAVKRPQDILDQISRNGSDLFSGDLVTKYTDAGIVLDFVFPPKKEAIANAGTKKAIGLDMWDDAYTTDMSPLGQDTPNVTGTHSRAYVHHLLDAHEMTALVLLQIHNLHAFRLFFEGIQRSLEAGTFEEDAANFKMVYEDPKKSLLAKTGEGQKSRAPKRARIIFGAQEEEQ